MNTIDKIKKLFNDPYVESVSFVSTGLKTIPKGEVLTVSGINRFGFVFAKNAHHYEWSIDEESIGEVSAKFHNPDEIEIGDTVMTRDGEGEVKCVLRDKKPYLVLRDDEPMILNGHREDRQYYRHEIALLKKAVK